MRNEQSVNNGTSVYMCYIIILKRKEKSYVEMCCKAFYHFEFLPFSIKCVSSMSMFGFTGGRCSWGGRRGRFSGKMQIWS